MMVTVVDEQGNGVADPKLRVEAQLSDDGQWRACYNERQHLNAGNDPIPTPTWRCGGDTPGTYNVRATLGEMNGRTEGVRVNMADRCHVRTQDVEVVLQ